MFEDVTTNDINKTRMIKTGRTEITSNGKNIGRNLLEPIMKGKIKTIGHVISWTTTFWIRSSKGR